MEEIIILPGEYQQVEYIESHGEEYINTGIKANSNIKMEVTLINPDMSDSDDHTLCGGGVAWGEQYLQLQCRLNSMCSYGDDWNRVDFHSGNITTICQDKNNFYQDGELLSTFSPQQFNTNYDIHIFCAAQSNVPAEFSSFKVAAFKIYNDNNLVRDFIACVRVTDNEAGLYDLVTETFYTNEGSGAFTYPDTPVDNRLSQNLERIRNATNDMREVLELTLTDPIENLSDAVEVLKNENEEMAEELEHYIPTDISTEEEMDALLTEANYKKKFRYVGEDCKYKPNAVFEVKRKFKTDNIVKNFAGFHAASGLTNYTLSINCSIGAKLLAFITVRDTNFTISEGWNVLGTSDLISNNPKQFMIIATKTTTELLETLTVTQETSQTMWIDIVELPAEAEIILDGFTYPRLNTINITAGPGCKMYGLCYVYNADNYPFGSNPEVLHSLWDYTTTYVAQRQGVLWGYLNEEQNFDITPSNNYTYDQTVALASLTINNVIPDEEYVYYLDYTEQADVLNNLHVVNSSILDLSLYPNRSLETACKYIERIQQGMHIVSPYQLFYGLNSLKYIDKLNWSQLQSNLNNASYHLKDTDFMFYECFSLRTLPELPAQWSTPYLTNTNSMFRSCRTITSVPYIDTSLSTNIIYMYYDCQSLTGTVKIDVSNVDLTVNGGGVFNSLFSYDYLLKEIVFKSSIVRQPKMFNSVFYLCRSLEKIDLSCFDFSEAQSSFNNYLFQDVPTNCLILVKDQEQKDILQARYTNMTNIKTIDEYEGGNN